MIPRFPLFALQGSAAALRKLPASRVKLAEVGGASKPWIRRLGDLDEYVWGRRRDADHQFAHREMKVKCLEIAAGSADPAGYVYYAAQQVGPLCARTRRLQLQLLRPPGDPLGAAGAALRGTVPGINPTVPVGVLRARCAPDSRRH